MPTATEAVKANRARARTIPPAGKRARLRNRLRTATAEAHWKLDEKLGRFDLTRPAGYRQFLEANAAALLPLEDTLLASGVVEEFPDWPQRSRTAAILADLSQLGGDARPLQSAPQFSLETMLGTLYVLESSRLGAAVLLRTVEGSPDPLVASTTAFLSHGLHQGLWQSFLKRMESHAPALNGDAGVVAGALQTLALFEDAAARDATDAGIDS